MTAQELVNWYYHGEGAAFHDELGEIFGLKSFLAGNTGAQAGGWFSNEIKGPEDFNGLKFRMPGLGGKALGKLGASVQNIPGAEVYQALASGAIYGTPSGSAHGRTKRPASRRSPTSITRLVFTSRALVCPTACTAKCSRA